MLRAEPSSSAPVAVSPLTTGARIRLCREARGLSRPVLAGLVGRSPDWLKKIERGTRRLNSWSMLVRIAQVLEVSDLSELTGAESMPVDSWSAEVHHVVVPIRAAMRDVAFPDVHDPSELPLDAGVLQARVDRLWRVWHVSPRQRTDVGRLLPGLVRQAHRTVRTLEGAERRRARAATGDLYRLVQRLLAHICEHELHALAVERGRAMSEEADEPLSLALAAWSSSVSLCASGDYGGAASLADRGAAILSPLLDRPGAPDADAWGTLGALQLEAAAAHALAGREGDTNRYLDAAARTAGRLPEGAWHHQSGFDAAGVHVLAVVAAGCLHRHREVIARARRPDAPKSPSVVRRSRLLVEAAHAHAQLREPSAAVQRLTSAAEVSTEAVALIPWVRDLADRLATEASGSERASAERLTALLKTVR